jgi:hypothetical protein
MQNSKFAGKGKGVTYNSRARLWMAYIDSPGRKRIYLGYTRTEVEALEMVKAAKC